MRDILDLANLWIGTFGGAIVAENKAPVAVDDTLSVLMDSGPVSVFVLVNDGDPEAQPLTLVSAVAALGTAVAEADNSVTYTPPPGISGTDTVVYEIADDLDQRSTGQINVTISEPDLSINTLSNNTLVVSAATGPIDLTVVQPTAFAGTTLFNTTDLQSGPVNLALPEISGAVVQGQELTAVSGLWACDGVDGQPMQSWQWRRNGSDILGATAMTYTVQVADLGTDLSLLETQSDSFGQRVAESPSVNSSGAAFIPPADPLLINWYDAADGATITGGLEVAVLADKAGTADLIQSTSSQRPNTGVRTLNGLNVLDCDGTDFLAGTVALPSSGDVALHMALVIDGLSSQYAAVLALDATNDMQIDANSDIQFDGRLNLARVGSSVGLSGGPFSGPVILSVIFDRTGTGTAEVFVGGVSRGSTAYTTPLDAAAQLHVMTNRSKNAEIDGAICELVITGDVSNRADHHAYLSNKWGVS